MKLISLCLVIACIVYVDCKGGGRGGGGRGRGRGGRRSGGRSGGQSGGGSGDSFKTLSGSGKISSGSHTHPASSGYSGHSSGSSHSYPSSNGLSGLGDQRGINYGQRYGVHSLNSVPRVPSYYTVPQYVYVHQYRNSNSRYNDLLTGLAMYNMGRSHVVYHHYYHDSYYRRSSSPSSNTVYESSSSSTPAEDKINESDEATCLLRIIEDGKEEVLKIPCAIVTTFVGEHKVPDASDTSTTVVPCLQSTLLESTENDNYASKSEPIVNQQSPFEDQSICKTTVKTIDPLSVTGSPLNVVGMECKVEIWSPLEFIRSNVECKTLLRYAKMLVPENKDTIIMPTRSELKKMLDQPPWWLSLFLAV